MEACFIRLLFLNQLPQIKLFGEYCYSPVLLRRLKKSAVRLSGTSRFSFGAFNFSFSLAQWARDGPSHLSKKIINKRTNYNLPRASKILELLIPKAS